MVNSLNMALHVEIWGTNYDGPALFLIGINPFSQHIL